MRSIEERLFWEDPFFFNIFLANRKEEYLSMNALPLKSNKNTSKYHMCMTVSTFVLDILIRKTEFVTAEM